MISDEYEELCEQLLKQKIDPSCPVAHMLEPYINDCRVVMDEKHIKERSSASFGLSNEEKRAMRINVKRVSYETWVQVLGYIASGFALGISWIIVGYIQALIALWIVFDPSYQYGEIILTLVQIVVFIILLTLVVYFIYRISKKSANVSKAEDLGRLLLAYELEYLRLPHANPIVKLDEDSSK